MEDKIVVDEEECVRILEEVLRQNGLPFRRTKPNEQGGFFVKDKDGGSRRLSREEVFEAIFGK